MDEWMNESGKYDVSKLIGPISKGQANTAWLLKGGPTSWAEMLVTNWNVGN
jgi:hypothetical protein